MLDDQLTLLVEDAGNDLYKLTMPILVAANIGRLDIVKELSKKFFSHFNIQNQLPSSYYAWLLSRVLIAQPSSEKKTILKLQKYILELLPEDFIEEDCFTAWAYSYLCLSSIYDDDLKQQMIAASTYISTENISNFLWTHIMVAYTSAKANDDALFQNEIEIILHATLEDNLADALNHIPINDFRTWAIALLFSVQQEENSLFELLDETLKNPDVNFYDRTLAKSVIPQFKEFFK